MLKTGMPSAENLSVAVLGAKVREALVTTYHQGGGVHPQVMVFGHRNPRTLEVLPACGGHFTFMPAKFTEETKEAFAAEIRRHAATADAYAVLLLCEVWYIPPNAQEAGGQTVPRDATEALFMQIEHLELGRETQVWTADIVRTPEGTALVQPWVERPKGECSGRMSRLLPSQQDVAAEQERISAMLAVKGTPEN
jgi:hypothetical protein